MPSRTSPRRSARRRNTQTPSQATTTTKNTQDDDPEETHDDGEVEEATKYVFDNVEYETYHDMVQAKRQRNTQRLVDSGLLEAAEAMKPSRPVSKQKKKRPVADRPAGQRRKSKRISGVASDGLFVQDEHAGKFTVGNASGATVGTNDAGDITEVAAPVEEFYRGRVNDGSPLTLEECVQGIGQKWLEDSSVSDAQDGLFRTTLLASYVAGSKAKTPSSGRKTSPKSVMSSLSAEKPPRQSGKDSALSLEERVEALSVDDEDCVAKVVPDRIYGIAVHPALDRLIVSAGDKSGYVGIWNVDGRSVNEASGSSDGTYLFKYHSGAVNGLQWTPSGSALMSTSYDGTVRWFDVETETCQQLFATYDDDEVFKEELGFAMDTGYHFYTQFGCLDHRSPNEKTFFLSTSAGTAMHVDLRVQQGAGRVTFHQKLSEKKINSLSLHPNGHSLVSGGLDCLVQVWDIRKWDGNRSSTGVTMPKPVTSHHSGKSVNSAMVSPGSGRYVVSTTQAHKLDVYDNMHLAVGNKVKPTFSIRHDNMTGRWLSTFMANFHPTLDIFTVGSMSKPRCVEIFDATTGKRIRAIQGDAMTAVASRCCFHRSEDKLVVVGGNSSGRVTVIR